MVDISTTKIRDVMRIALRPFGDARGVFKETYHLAQYSAAGIGGPFVQDNVSVSARGVLRGMHWDPRLSKLTQVLHGTTYHVLADMRRGSPTFRTWESFELDAGLHEQLFVPAGVANGFLVLSETAVVHYRQTAYYDPSSERTLRWNDPFVSIHWPTTDPILSEKDGTTPDYLPSE